MTDLAPRLRTEPSADPTDLVTVVARAAADAKAETRRAAAAWKDAETDVLDTFIGAGITTVALANGDGTHTRVTAEGMDETTRSVLLDAALTLLNRDQLAAVVSQVITLAALDAAVDAGVIPAALAAQCVTVRQTKPSVRVTFNAKLHTGEVTR